MIIITPEIKRAVEEAGHELVRLTEQGTKASAYIGSHYLCDFAHTQVGYACILRGSEGKRRVEIGSPVPSEYRPFYCVDYRQVTGYSGSGVPDNVWSVVVPLGDSASIASVAVRRWLAKRSK